MAKASRSSQSQWHWFGASVRGPAHIKDGRPNQDAWNGRSRRFGSAVVVCDGLGSRKHSAEGSKAACLAVFEALRLWVPWPGAPVDLLIRTIHTLWSMRVHQLGIENCFTTCLFAAVTPKGALVVAQLGDGLAAIRPPGGPSQLLAKERVGFANQTTGLGIARSTTDWSVVIVPNPQPETLVLLTTDGVADDLVTERLDELIVHLSKTFRAVPKRSRSAMLAWQLRKWETPLHSDDKTLAMFWNGPEGEPDGDG